MKADEKQLELGLGVDPGLRACGIALVANGRMGWSLLTAQTVKTTTKLPFIGRLQLIDDALTGLLTARQLGKLVRWVAVEDPLYVIAGKQERKETNFDALRLLAVYGMACGWAFRIGAALVTPEPTQGKRAVGAPANGTAAQVIRCARAVVTGCPADLDEHQAHAIGAAMAGARMLQFESAVAKGRKRS